MLPGAEENTGPRRHSIAINNAAAPNEKTVTESGNQTGSPTSPWRRRVTATPC